MAHPGSPETRYTYYDEFTDRNGQGACTESTDNHTDKASEPPSTCPPQVTKTLLHATDSTPAITFARYGSMTDDIFPSTSTIVSQMPGSKPETTAVVRTGLDSYFDGLRREFEDKTGRVWIPLGPVKTEDWDWEGELVVAEVEDNDGDGNGKDIGEEDVDDEEAELDFLDGFKLGTEFDDADLDLRDFRWGEEVSEEQDGDVRDVCRRVVRA